MFLVYIYVDLDFPPNHYQKESKSDWPPLFPFIQFCFTSPYSTMSDKETHGHFNESDSNSNRAETAGIDEKYEKQLMYPPLHLNPPTIGVADGNHGSRKVDWRLLPILGALYSVALIDRLNVSSPARKSIQMKFVWLM